MKKMSLLALGVSVLSMSLLQADNEFEIYNKASNPIWYTLTNAGKSESYKASPRGTRKLPLDISKQTTLEIWTTDPGAARTAAPSTGVLGRLGRAVQGVVEKAYGPNPDQVYTFSMGKTIYVTWDDKQILRPQTGPLMGLLGKTESGLRLSNNVKQADITKQRS